MDQSAPGMIAGRDAADASLWRDLGTGGDQAPQAWLGLTVQSMPGAVAGVLLLAPDAGSAPSIVGQWPAGLPPTRPLLDVAGLARENRRGAAQEQPGGQALVATPILLDGDLIGVAAIELSAKPRPDLRVAMRHLQWAIPWVRDHARARLVAEQRTTIERQSVALDLLAGALEQPGFLAACRNAATEVATRLGCERVSIGFVRHGRASVAAMSHTASFGRRLNLVRLLGDAMDEAIDQEAVILHPNATEPPLATRAHADLLAEVGRCVVLSVPMAFADRARGAMVFQRGAGEPFSQDDIDLAEAVAAILGPALLDKRAIDRPLALLALDAAHRQARRWLGAGHLGRKLAAVGVAVGAVTLYLAIGPYRIAGDGQVEGAVQRAVVAPFDGFVLEAPARAGAVLAQGALVVALDDRDLVLERARWLTERAQHVHGYSDALAKQNRADAQRFLNQRDEADAQIRLVDEQLARARIGAPFEGLVVSGDLSQSIGAPVRRGDTLFEMAPLRDYRLELLISEREIADVVPGQSGEILVAALPDQPFPFTVQRVTPVAIAREGRMLFKVDARLDATSDRLRPGMEGVGKIEAGHARLAWIWTRSLIHWATIAWWRLL